MIKSMKCQIENIDNTWKSFNLALIGILEKEHERVADKKYSIPFWTSRQIKACSWCCTGQIFNTLRDLAPYHLRDSSPHALFLSCLASAIQASLLSLEQNKFTPTLEPLCLLLL